ncbi:MAG: PorP/SprF family type IX secretion system membrane protein [Paludibacteraceae bacterium]|nr:PorP/SprF family type IX secretion system membrane protein [Paludibacteraceae bacterium]
MKRYIVLLFFVVVALALKAQFDPMIGQYMLMPTAYNPAAAGDGNLMKVSGLHRMQFTGIRNAPMTTYFSFYSPFRILKTNHGAGIRFMNDRYGLFTNRTLHLQYAYRQKLGNGFLAAGVDMGFLSVGFKGDSVNLSQLSGSTYHKTDDQLIPTKEETGMGFDLGVGVYYSSPRWWAGISYSHLTKPKILWGEYASIRVKGTFYAAGGYNWQLRNKKWVIKPSAFVMTDFTSWSIALTALVQYKDKYRWGLTYHIADDVALLFSVDIISGLTLGYTYELPTSSLLKESYGSHEVYLAYGFDILKPKRNNKYKSIRYL